MSHYLTLIQALPLTGALAALLVPKGRETWVHLLAALVATAAALLTVPLWFWTGPDIGVDGYSLLLVLLTALGGALAAWLSAREATVRPRLHDAALLAMQGALFCVFTANSVAWFFVAWQAALAAMFVLIRASGAAASRDAARRFAVSAVAGSLATLTGLVALAMYASAGSGASSVRMADLQALAIPLAVQRWSFVALGLGVVISTAMMPFHRWLTDAATELPAAVQWLAAVLRTVGVYGFIRITLPALPEAARGAAPYLGGLCLVAILWSGTQACRQRDWRRLTGCLSISQLAMALLAALAFNPVALTGGMLLQVTHGLMAITLLVAAGTPRRPVATLMTLSATGLPLAGGFVSALLILQGLATSHVTWAAGAAIGFLLTSVAVWRGWPRVISQETGGDRRIPRGVARLEVAAAVPLLAVTFWIGLYPGPFLALLATPVQRVVARVSPGFPATAAECDTTVTPAMKAANPAAQFLEAAPCGPDGEPLPPASSTRP